MGCGAGLGYTTEELNGCDRAESFLYSFNAVWKRENVKLARLMEGREVYKAGRRLSRTTIVPPLRYFKLYIWSTNFALLIFASPVCIHQVATALLDAPTTNPLMMRERDPAAPAQVLSGSRIPRFAASTRCDMWYFGFRPLPARDRMALADSEPSPPWPLSAIDCKDCTEARFGIRSGLRHREAR
jgi:hypothetical protein